MITTNVVWLNQTPTSADKQTISDQAALMQSEGKTDNVSTYMPETPVSTQYTIVRTWVDNTAAEEWITFILTYNPVSAQIVG